MCLRNTIRLKERKPAVWPHPSYLGVLPNEVGADLHCQLFLSPPELSPHS